MNKYRDNRAQEHKSKGAQVACALSPCALLLFCCSIFGAAKTDQSLKTHPPPGQQIENLKYQLRQDNLSPLPTSLGRIEESVSARPIDDDLQKLIAQIRSARISQEQPAPSVVEGPVQQPVITPEPAQAAESSAVTESEPKETKDRVVVNSAPVLRSADQAVPGKISDLTLRAIDGLLNDPNKSQNLTKLEPKQAGFKYKELAEVLFKCGKFSQAGQCYKRAYELLPADDANLVGDRNWVLFQMGNCFEYDDPNTARENFALLLRTNPTSPWADVAKFRHDLADWLQKEQPKKLIEELNQKSESDQ
jgi:tetratricopeptide (TPR) repeat protein